MDEDRASLLLLLLLSTDYVFIVLHIINRINPFEESNLFRVDYDGSYPEIFQYLKFFWMIVLLASVLIATKSKGYLSWVFIFLYFLLDDALQIHEQMGLVLADAFAINPPLALRGRDVGELAVFAFFGAVLIPLVVWAYLRGSRAFRDATKDLMILLAAFVFFVVFLDVVHAAVDLGSFFNRALALVEDGGEMLVASLMLWYVFLLALRNGELDVYLHKRLAHEDGAQPG